ncbi:hypothetical protein [Cupriavidus cauae]|uniref:Uncharacterized protein n=1 Tax=Cupriavidus cauae TaxID=2608999 RepID=A0A5M8B5F5_9BURK|nr:hypothetical protein [Cupriavidus cauae]KAA6129676.1 hypothetical protein F1599_05290 [Cupriavidus cauae]
MDFFKVTPCCCADFLWCVKDARDGAERWQSAVIYRPAVVLLPADMTRGIIRENCGAGKGEGMPELVPEREWQGANARSKCSDECRKRMPEADA